MSNRSTAPSQTDAGSTASAAGTAARGGQATPQQLSLPQELNQQLGRLENDLEALRFDIRSINKGVKASLKQLTERDTDLTGKVAETYQRLGSLDEAYRDLSGKSTRIGAEIKQIAGQLQQLAGRSEAEIGALQGGVQDLLKRSEELGQQARQTTQALNKSIKENSAAMAALEQQLKAEIADLAERSQQRHDDLYAATVAVAARLDATDDQVRNQQARLLKMQDVDQALERRAGALEQTTEALSQTSRELSRATSLLTRRSNELATAVQALEARTLANEASIADLHDQTAATERSLLALMRLEKRHVQWLGGGLALVLLLVLGFYLSEQYNWSSEAQINSGLEADIQDVQQQVSATRSSVADVQSDLSTTGQGLADLSGQVARIDDATQDRLQQIEQHLVSVGDQVDSIDGRVTNLRPHREFGNGNVIHGPEWLANQPLDHHAIRLASVSDKQDLYRVAERYGHYLQHELAYLPVSQPQGQTRYLLLMGSFATVREAQQALRSLPHSIEFQRPTVAALRSVLN